jgi:peptidoglycan/LPS O-acetylase OafA/YrhL
MFTVTNIRAEALPLGLLTAFAVGIGLLLLAVVVRPGSLLARILGLPPLVFVGKISYALYLWHNIILVAFQHGPVAVKVVLSFAAAIASYYVVELPFLRLKRRDRARVDAGEAAPPAAAATMRV